MEKLHTPTVPDVSFIRQDVGFHKQAVGKTELMDENRIW